MQVVRRVLNAACLESVVVGKWRDRVGLETLTFGVERVDRRLTLCRAVEGVCPPLSGRAE